MLAQHNPSSGMVIASSISGDFDDHLVYYDLDTFEQVHIPIDNVDTITDLSISPDASYIAITEADSGGTQRIFIITYDGAVIQYLNKHLNEGYEQFGLNWLSSDRFSFITYHAGLNASQFCVASISALDNIQCRNSSQQGYINTFQFIDDQRFVFSMTNRDIVAFEWPKIEPRIFLAEWYGDHINIIFDFIGEAPTVSSDHEALAYCLANEDGFFDVYVSNIDGREQSNITNSESISECNPSWSFDNEYLSFESRLAIDERMFQPQKICVYHEGDNIICISDEIASDNWGFYDAIWSPYNHQIILYGTDWDNYNPADWPSNANHYYLLNLDDIQVYTELEFTEAPLPEIHAWLLTTE